MAERINERVARHIVSQALNVPVSRFEDGLADSQVDALIHYPDRHAALEVIGDHEEAFNRQWAALDRLGHRLIVPGLRYRWCVQLARRAKINEVARKLPAMLLRYEDEPDELSSARARWGTAPDNMAALGVLMVYIIGGGPAGRVDLHVEGWSGSAGSGAVGAWVAEVLESQPDVPAKLLAHPTSEKHAFIWTTIGSSYSVQFAIENRAQPLPEVAPELPEGVTHVWVAGSFTSQGCLAWFPDRGWWRVPWAWPSGPLELAD